VLREHLTRGFSLDRQRFEKNAAELEAALALLVAESDAKNKDVMIRLIENMLALPVTQGEP
jgi:chromosomal replication initiation ATPase DnaA